MDLLPRLARMLLQPDARVAAGLLLAFVALLPADPLYNAPLLILAVLGVAQLASGRARLHSPRYRFLCIAFLCIWLPMVASLPDAVNPPESYRKTASLFVYLLAGVYVVAALRSFHELRWVMTGSAAICGIWILDALWQFQTGTDWFGFPYTEGERLTGMFYTGRIGGMLALFAPLAFESVRWASRRWRWTPALLVPYFLVIALSGSRTSWGSLAIAIVGYLLYLAFWAERPSPGSARRRLKDVGVVSASIVLAVILAALAWPGVAERAWATVQPRIESLSGLWSGDREKIELAVTYRLSVWETALKMWSAHWLNGVGPRGFQYAYQEHNPETDYYLLHDGRYGAAKTPHFQLLEIATETGAIGLLGYLILATVFLRSLGRLERASFRSTFPFALVLIVALFPFSGHMAFYSVRSAGLIWWIIIANACAFSVASGKPDENTAERTRQVRND